MSEEQWLAQEVANATARRGELRPRSRPSAPVSVRLANQRMLERAGTAALNPSSIRTSSAK